MEGFESLMHWIRISILESEDLKKNEERFESLKGGFESPRENLKQKLQIEVDLHSDKECHFCLCFRHFLAWSISKKKIKIKSKTFKNRQLRTVSISFTMSKFYQQKLEESW